jgi:hypothetical protein
MRVSRLVTLVLPRKILAQPNASAAADLRDELNAGTF